MLSYYDVEKQLLSVNCEVHCHHYSRRDKNVLVNASMLQGKVSCQFKNLSMSEFSLSTVRYTTEKVMKTLFIIREENKCKKVRNN